MEETILVPSPNWFEVSILRAASDGWVVYGGPNKTLVVLEPVPSEYKGAIDGDQRFKAHVVFRAHKEKISCVDVSPEWPEKRHFITGSADGIVKEWSITKEGNNYIIKNLHSHEIHAKEKEEVIGVGYCTATHAISIGSFSIIAKWELTTNLVKSYPHLMKSFKAVCMSCSPHLPFHVAAGTKQGVIFVLDLTGNGKIVYKVRGQDDEITQVSWCPQYEVILKRALDESRTKSFLAERLEKIRNEPEPANLETSAVDKNLPDDSFDESIVQEDDMFDIYKDHEDDEFGHKKYVPETIVIKKKAEPANDDFLAECEKLKSAILKMKQEDEQSIQSLVDAMDNTHVDSADSDKAQGTDDKSLSKDDQKSSEERDAIDQSNVPESSSSSVASKDAPVDASSHIHKHLLASIGKCGSVRIWSKAGKIVASCSIHSSNKGKSKQPQYCTLCWYKPDSLLLADGKVQLLECNPMNIDKKNKLSAHVVHSEHRRGLYCIQTDAPRVQTAETTAPNKGWSIWTVAQDRYLVKYSMEEKKTVAKLASCGGYLYEIKSCPYDAGKIAIGVGDGAVRVWETQPSEDESKVLPGSVGYYWQHVQGKVLACAWHPTKENLLAFSTAESRVGIVETQSKGGEKPARPLRPALSGGVYSLCWGEDGALLACGGGDLVRYHAARTDDAPTTIRVVVEGLQWEISAVRHSARGLAVGGVAGGVAVITTQGDVLAAKIVFTKMIHMIDWHPQQTSNSDEESQYKDLLAVCSLDKDYTIAILKYSDKEDGGKQLTSFNKLIGHKSLVYQVYWSPHNEGQLLSTSRDSTVRVWDAISGSCVSIFGGHSGGAIAGAWLPSPALPRAVLSGGSDCCLRLWDFTDYPPHLYQEVKREKTVKKKSNKEKATEVKETNEDASDDSADKVATIADYKMKAYKRFLLPICARQLIVTNLEGVRTMVQNYVEKNKKIDNVKDICTEETPPECNVDFLNMFGNINDVNELLDKEGALHLQYKNYESYMMLMIFRGHMDSLLKFANERDLIDRFLLTLTPCVSVKFYKDAVQLYIAQMDRLAAKGEDDKLFENKYYGGVTFCKAATLLAAHDVTGALEVLKTASMFKEAYILCRVRHMDSLARDTLQKWASTTAFTGELVLSAVLYLALGDIVNAASVLRRSKQKESLALAGELAKIAGLPSLADFMEAKAAEVVKPVKDQTEELLKELPSKIELLMKNDMSKPIESEVTNGHKDSSKGQTPPSDD